MTDTGRIPAEGVPENGVADASPAPHPGHPGNGADLSANGVPQQPGWGGDPLTDPLPPYDYLEQPPPPGAGLDDEDDVLLMPGPQGTWSDPQPVPPPAPVPPSAPLHLAAQISVEVPTEVPVENVAPMPAPAPAPRRPLHMGPPMPETATGGVSVRSLADRGPAVAGPPTSGPEYLDVPREDTSGIPAQQTGDSGSWPVPATEGSPSQHSLIPHADSVIPAQAQTFTATPPAQAAPGVPVVPAQSAAPVGSQGAGFTAHAPAEGPQFAAAVPVAVPAVDGAPATPGVSLDGVAAIGATAQGQDHIQAQGQAAGAAVAGSAPVALPDGAVSGAAAAGAPGPVTLGGGAGVPLAGPVEAAAPAPAPEQASAPVAARAPLAAQAPVQEAAGGSGLVAFDAAQAAQGAPPEADPAAEAPAAPVPVDPAIVNAPVAVESSAQASGTAETPAAGVPVPPAAQAPAVAEPAQSAAPQHAVAAGTPAHPADQPAAGPAPAAPGDTAGANAPAAGDGSAPAEAAAVVPPSGDAGAAQPVAAASAAPAQPQPEATAAQDEPQAVGPAANAVVDAASSPEAVAVQAADAAGADAPAQQAGEAAAAPETDAAPVQVVAADDTLGGGVPAAPADETAEPAPAAPAVVAEPAAVAQPVVAAEAPGTEASRARHGAGPDSTPAHGTPVAQGAPEVAAAAAAGAEAVVAAAPANGTVTEAADAAGGEANARAAHPAPAPAAESAPAKPRRGGRRRGPAAAEPAVAAPPEEQPANEPAQPEPAAQATAPQEPAAEPYEPAVRDAVHRVIRERRDIRNGFRSDPIPHDVLLRVLEAAHTAPSVGHSQPWDFVVIRSEKTREKMHELAMRQREAYAKSLPKARARQFRELKIEAILDTPVNIVVTADPTRGGRHTLGRHTQPQMAPYSSALAVENLWLAARAEGLGVGWVSFFDERQMVTELGLPEHLEVVAYLCIGYVDEFPDEPELMQAGWSQRRPLAWVVHEEEYGNRALPGEEPHDLLEETLRGIRPLDAKALGEAWERQKRMTKPAGALGMLEIISAQLSGLSRQCPPPIPEPAAVAIFAGDHGVHAQGVTSWPQEVTAQMVANFLGGGAVCNAFANQVGAEVCVIDVGVAAELPSTPGLLPRKVRPGTADFTTGPAMTREEVLRAVEVGIETARDLVAAGNKALLTGEMGIANTTASAAIISVFTGADPAEVTGRGTGINDEMHARKIDVVRRALELHRPDPSDPIAVLTAVGGLEHAAMVGLLLGGAALRTPVILDGVSAGAAALVARAIAPEVLAACIAGHRSAEPGHMAALTTLGLRPLVDLDLRLGEGTGALLALPLVQSAARVMHEVATFDAAGVTEKG